MGVRAEAAKECVRFELIDKIEFVSDTRLVGVKYVSLAEEYLADHFPSFPVLPGVLMLESAAQGAGWLLHLQHDFSGSMAILKEARNVKYGNFVAAGDFLRIEVELVKLTDSGGMFKASGSVNNATALQGRLELAYFNLADRDSKLAEIDAGLREHNRRRWELLKPRQGQQIINNK